MDEWQQYCYDQAKAWLEHISKLKYAERASKNMVELYTSLLDSANGIDYTREHVSGGQYTDRVADVIVKLDEAKLEWEANLVAYTNEAIDAAQRIEQLEDKAEMQALLLHYVDGKTWEKVCVQMDYSYENIMLIRRRGVLNMYDLMPLDWRDPRPSAV